MLVHWYGMQVPTFGPELDLYTRVPDLQRTAQEDKRM
jgi:hypothetical protein